jgi:hypothetical protein
VQPVRSYATVDRCAEACGHSISSPLASHTPSSQLKDHLQPRSATGIPGPGYSRPPGRTTGMFFSYLPMCKGVSHTAHGYRPHLPPLPLPNLDNTTEVPSPSYRPYTDTSSHTLAVLPLHGAKYPSVNGDPSSIHATEGCCPTRAVIDFTGRPHIKPASPFPITPSCRPIDR